MNELFNKQRLELISFIEDNFSKEETIDTKIPALTLYRRTDLSEFMGVIYDPSLCVVLQGSKAVGFGNDLYSYSANKYLIASTHIPASVRIEEASEEKPFFALKLAFNLEDIYEVSKEFEDQKVRNKADKGLFFDKMSLDILNPISRLIKLQNTPQKNIDFLSPLIIKEILYVLLNGDSGEFLRQYLKEGSSSNQILKAIIEIKKNFTESINMKNLSETIGISESSLYHNFKKITSLSPLQFQKKIRLEEAKQMLINQNLDASQVAFEVGYESPSQFSREYSRMYGMSPKAHASILKQNVYN